MSTYKDFLLKELSQGIINITFTDNLQVPYTTLSRNITQSDDIKTVKVYNLITEKTEDLSIKNIASWCVDELCNNNYIEECKKDLDGIDEENAYKFYFNIITKQYKLFDSLKLFKFCLSPKEFISNHMSNQQLNIIKGPFINLVKFKINEIAVELDEIAATSEDDDLEDIKTIKEMFEECVSDIDFCNVKNITDLIDCWPPLLLPLPESLENIKQCLLRVSPVEDSSKIKSDLEYIIQDNDNVSLLQEFLEVLEVNKNDIDIKKYNDSKNVIEKRLNILNDIT